MRFWDVQAGAVSVSDVNVREINTQCLRDTQSFVTQETQLFHDSIENSIKIAKLDATHDEVVQATKKALLDAFISTLPDGYQTQVGELGEPLSGGEGQHIGIARLYWSLTVSQP